MAYDKTSDQLRECPFCNGDGELDIDENHNHFVSCIECRAEGSRAACASDAANAWNTRPTAVASHAEGEVVAWMVTRDRDPTFPRTYSEKERAVACVASVTLPPFAKIVDLYTDPRRSGDEAVDARVANVVRQMRNCATDVAGAKSITGAWIADTLNWFADEMGVDAAMAARGGS